LSTFLRLKYFTAASLIFDEPTSSSNNSVKKQKADDPPEKTGDDFDALVNVSDGELEAESGEEDSNDTDTLLNELEECFGSDEKCGDSISDKLAKVTSSREGHLLSAF
jgi:hypothetical protein